MTEVVLKIGDKIRMSALGVSVGILEEIIPIGTVGEIVEFYDLDNIEQRHVRVKFDIQTPYNTVWYYGYDDAVSDLV